jgi:PAS domain S-box-containing protein
MEQDNRRNPMQGAKLRQRAEEVLAANPLDTPTVATGKVQALIHELNVHQIELEIQNEELRQAQVDLSHAHDHYADLYDFAPVGYVILDRGGTILNANLTAAAMLGVERRELLQTPITRFLSGDLQDAFYFHREAVFSSDMKETCETKMQRSDGTAVVVRFESAAFASDGARRCRSALIDITEARRTQRQLEESDQRYHRLTDAVIDHIFTVTVDSRRRLKTVHGPNCEVFTGFTPEEYDADPSLWSSAVVEEDRALVENHDRQTLACQSPGPVEYRIRLKDGSLRWVLRVTSPQFGEHGDLTTYDGLLQDISTKKAAEASLHMLHEELEQQFRGQTLELQGRTDKLRESERAFSTLMNSLPGAAYRCENDRRRTALYISDGIEQVTGHPARNFIEVKVELGDLIHLEDRGSVWNKIQTSVAARKPYQLAYRLMRRDGSPRMLWEQGEGVFSPDGKLLALEGYISDISELKQTEDELQMLSNFSENLISTSQSLILVLDSQARIVRFNPAFELLTGWNLDEVEGQDWFEHFIPERNQERIRQLFTTALKGDRTRANVNPIVTRSGDEREIEWYDAPLTSPEGELIGLLCTGTDVTERLLLEQEVIDASEEERRRIAQDLHDDLGSHLTGIDFRLKALATRLSKCAGTSEVERCQEVQALLQQAIRKTRSISKGLHAVGSHPEDIMTSLKELIDRAREGSGKRCQFRCANPVLIQDPIKASHLFRIAQEAVNNALKYSEGTQITLSLAQRDGEVSLQVTDNGIGFDQQLEQESRGLGLHIMNYRASAIGGVLSICQRKGGGTRVVCKAPRKPRRAGRVRRQSRA